MPINLNKFFYTQSISQDLEQYQDSFLLLLRLQEVSAFFMNNSG